MNNFQVYNKRRTSRRNSRRTRNSDWNARKKQFKTVDDKPMSCRVEDRNDIIWEKCSSVLINKFNLPEIWFQKYKLLRNGTFKMIFKELPKGCNIEIKISSLNKWIYDKSTEMVDQNCFYHPVLCGSCNIEVGKFYITTTKRMKRYQNKICIISSNVKESIEPEFRYYCLIL